ncbi:MAG: hypothetical protein IJZ42_06775 [Lachnospiraceae bacterium]|nr:hypothetical protein [Lachnospiraceae bacterium]
MNKKYLKNNRGAALVSVMIAVAFIAILASSLLYMAYSNYKMKIVNYESKANFYGTEHDMVVLSTAIRNSIANASSDPEGTLKTLVGVDATTGRYNPTALAKLVYDDITVPAAETNAELHVLEYDSTSKERRVRKDSATDADMTVKFSTAITDTTISNYVKTTAPEDPSVTMVTLSGVVIEQYDKEGNYVNKITTDLVYRFKESNIATDPGGVGQFSIISDTPMDVSASLPPRVTMYGNVFLSSGDYTYGADLDGNGVKDPVPSSNGTKPALHIAGDTVYTLVGDNMIVYGDVVIEGNAILNLISGSLTVIGNIYINGNGSLLCNGDIYFPPGDNPKTIAPDTYGISFGKIKPTGTDGSATNLIPSDMLTKHVKYISAANYQSLLGALGLTDGDSETNKKNDGVLAQIIRKTDTNTLYDYDSNDQITGNSKSLYGMGYSSRIYCKGGVINANDFKNELIFLGYTNKNADTTYNFNDGSNVHSTFICLAEVTYTNAKPFAYTQLGSEVFNKMIDPAYGFTIKAPDNTMMNVSDLFVADPNVAINKIINFGTNGGGGDIEVQVAVGYDNWLKE